MSYMLPNERGEKFKGRVGRRARKRGPPTGWLSDGRPDPNASAWVVRGLTREQWETLGIRDNRGQVVCPYCEKPAVLTDSAEIYGRSYGPIWLCRPCDARVGCHPDGETPLGSLAGPRLREMRKAFHVVFDKLWKDAPLSKRQQARGRWYKELAKRLDLPVAEVHGGQLTEETAPFALAEVEAMRMEQLS